MGTFSGLVVCGLVCCLLGVAVVAGGDLDLDLDLLDEQRDLDLDLEEHDND